MLAALWPFLPNLTAEDVRRLAQDANRVPSLLLDRNSAERNRTLRRWRYGPATVPDFAESIVRFLWSDLDHHDDYKGELLKALLPVALSNCEQDDYVASSLRDLLVSRYPTCCSDTRGWRGRINEIYSGRPPREKRESDSV